MNDGVVLANNVFGRGVGFTRVYLCDWMVNMRDIDLDVLKQKKCVVTFDDVREALSFLEAFKKQCPACYWGESSITDRYSSTFTLNPNFDGEKFKKLTYDDVGYYLSKGYSVINFSDLCIDRREYVDMTDDLNNILF